MGHTPSPFLMLLKKIRIFTHQFLHLMCTEGQPLSGYCALPSTSTHHQTKGYNCPHLPLAFFLILKSNSCRGTMTILSPVGLATLNMPNRNPYILINLTVGRRPFESLSQCSWCFMCLEFYLP